MSTAHKSPTTSNTLPNHFHTLFLFQTFSFFITSSDNRRQTKRFWWSITPAGNNIIKVMIPFTWEMPRIANEIANTGTHCNICRESVPPTRLRAVGRLNPHLGLDSSVTILFAFCLWICFAFFFRSFFKCVFVFWGLVGRKRFCFLLVY